MARAKARLPDWLFSAPIKRRVLEALLAEPDRAWTERALAIEVGANIRGSVDEHLAALVQMGLVERESAGDRYLLKPVAALEPHELVIRMALETLLPALRLLPDDEVAKPQAKSRE